MSERDGGPAFPVLNNVAWDNGEDTAIDGMSLRDYFAGQALAGMASRLPDARRDVDDLGARMAVAAYEIADAMLEAREDDNE